MQPQRGPTDINVDGGNTVLDNSGLLPYRSRFARSADANLDVVLPKLKLHADEIVVFGLEDAGITGSNVFYCTQIAFLLFRSRSW